MSKLILSMFMTLDGFVEAPGGGLIRPDWSEDMERNWSTPNVAPDSLLLYGRRAFEQNAPLWPAMERDENNSVAFRALARTMNELPKVVVSRTLTAPGWNATVSKDSLGDTVRRLKQSFAGEINAVGGVTLAATLLAGDLVDEYRLLLMPHLFGAGHSVFKARHAPIALSLEDVHRMDTGAVRLTYRRPRDEQAVAA
ncbi:dihydrofolate reductase family protein [Caulobacter sp. 1776]|uniref:dihydrofolate reductase family protein n=1 Tax=Caulobacter sp. 1776 TaxID=3156420 RepID=UPI003390FD61